MPHDRDVKIAVASSGLGHVARGIEAWAADLGAALYERGVNVTLYKGGGAATLRYERLLHCWKRDQSWVNRTWFPTRLLWRFGYGSPYMAEQTTFARSLIRELRKEPVDILHVQDPQVALIVQQSGAAKVILAHGTEEPPEFLKRIDYVQHLAPWHLEHAKMAGAWKPAWTAIPNFIDTERFSPGPSNLRQELGIPADAFVVLTAAAIKRHHKRIDHLIHEMANVKDAYLIVAGGWEADTDELIKEGTALLGTRVRFLVRFPRERMPELYRASDVFVLASLFEMMPIALVEACACGLPCITHDHPVMRWMTGPGGSPVDMSKTGTLASALTTLDSTLRSTLGAAARDHCLANFSTKSVVNRIVDYYHTVMANTTPGA
jgi:glycosyltransferase involved in cell wall biosynthesis